MKKFLLVLNSDLIIKVFYGIFLVLIAREYGPQAYGVLGLALSLGAIANLISDFGFNQSFVREMSNDSGENNLYNLMLVKVGSLLLTAFLLYFFIDIFFHNNKLEILFISVAYLINGSLSSLYISYNQAVQNFKKLSNYKIVFGLLNTLPFVLGYFYTKNVVELSYYYIAIELSVLVVILSILLLHLNKINVELFSIIKGSHMFFLTSILDRLKVDLPNMILARVTNLSDIGYFNASSKLINPIYMIPNVIALIFFPKMYKAHKNNELNKYKKLAQNQLSLMFFISILVTVPILSSSMYIEKYIFGAEWVGLHIFLNIMSVSLIVKSVNYPLANILTTSSLERLRAKISVLVLIVFSLIIIPLSVKFGSIGATYAILITEFISLLLYVIYLPSKRSLIKKGFLKKNTSLTLPSIILAASYVQDQNLLFILIYNIAFFTLFIYINKEIIKFKGI